MDTRAWTYRHRRNLTRAGFTAAVVMVAVMVIATTSTEPKGSSSTIDEPLRSGHDATAADDSGTGVGGQREGHGPPGFFPNPLKWMNYYLVLGYINLMRFMMRTTVIFPWQMSDVASDMSDTVTKITWASYVVFIMAAGLIVVTYQSLQSRYGAAQLLPRLVIGLAAASLGPWMLSQVAQIANALIKALGDYKEADVDDILDEAGETADITAMVLAAVTFMLLMVLVFHAATRLAVALVLYVFAPAALACHALPYTEALAQLWWRMLLATVASAVGQTAMLLMWFYASTGTEKSFLSFKASPSQALSPAQFIKIMMIIVFAFCVHKIHVHAYRWAGKSPSGGPAKTVKAVVAAVVLRSVHPLIGAAAGTAGGKRHGGRGAHSGHARPSAHQAARQPVHAGRVGYHHSTRQSSRQDLDAWATATPTGWKDGHTDADQPDPGRPNRPRVNLDAVGRADPYHPQQRRPKPRRQPQRLVVDRNYDDGTNRQHKRATPPKLPAHPRPPAAPTTATPQLRPLRSPHLWRGSANPTPSLTRTTPPGRPKTTGGNGES
ncbi:MAG: hypothetical protein ACRD0P_07975 [Stackebrandtia sp.]